MAWYPLYTGLYVITGISLMWKVIIYNSGAGELFNERSLWQPVNI